MKPSKILAYSCAIAAVVQQLNGQVVLTGLTQVGAAANGESAGSPIWNTLGNEISYANLFVTQPNSGFSAPFLNHGNSANVRLSYTLGLGTHEFYFFGDSFANINTPAYQLNLFFDGNNNSTPGISGFSFSGTTSVSPVAAGLGSLALSVNTNSPDPAPGTYIYTQTPVAAPGTLSYTANGLLVTLTSYGFGLPGQAGWPLLDRVGNLNDFSDGATDGVGRFTLSVVAVPEPSVLAVGVAGVVACLARNRKRPHSSVPTHTHG